LSRFRPEKSIALLSVHLVTSSEEFVLRVLIQISLVSCQPTVAAWHWLVCQGRIFLSVCAISVVCISNATNGVH